MSADKQAPLLIVEDDLALQKQIKWSLDRFESVTAHDRASALLAFRRHQPAVVTMDLGLPPDPDATSEGFKLLEQLLELDPHVKVIVLTGQNDQANA
jgi:two-component system NtrC family response regulator